MKLTVRDVAKLIHATEEEVYRLIRQGSIPCQRVHDQYRFNQAELLEWATSRGVRLSSSAFRAPREEGAAPPCHLADALALGGVHYSVPGADRAAVLRAIVDRMPIEAADREELHDFLAAREALGSTGVGDGIAIPHVRNPTVLGVTKP